MAWSVYLVRCADGSLYAGVSDDVGARVARHNAGKGARYTRSRLPVELVYQRRIGSKGRALSAEWRLKQLSRADKLVLVQRYLSRR